MKFLKIKWPTWRKGIGYFIDYYLVKTIMICVGVGLCVATTFHFVNGKTTNILYGAVIDGSLSVEVKNDLEQRLIRLYSADPQKQNVIIDDSFFSQEDALTKLQVYLANGQVDIIVADQEMFALLAGYGYLTNLNEISIGSAINAGSIDYYYCHGYGEEVESSDVWEDTQSGRGMIQAYGINIAASKTFDELQSNIENPVMGIAVNSKNIENSLLMIKMFVSQ